MAGLRTSLELIQDALEKAGEKSDGTSEYQSFVISQMNQRYKQILAGANVFKQDLGEPWSWAKARYPNILTLEPPYENGTVSLTEDSDVGTLSTPPSYSLTGRILKLSGRPDYIRIASHTASAPNFTLDAPYSEDTISSSAFAAHKIDYDLGASGGSTSGILRLFSPFRVYKSQAIDADRTGLISQLEQRAFEEKWPLKGMLSGTPTEFCQTYSFDGLISVRFNRSVSERTRLEYDYIPVPAELTYDASSVPIIPEAYRDVLSLLAAHDVLLDKEDDKAQTFFAFCQNQLAAMITAERKAQQNTRRNFGRIVPRLDKTLSRRLWVSRD